MVSFSNSLQPFDPSQLQMAERRLRVELEKRIARKTQSRKGGLIEFVRYFWRVLEPVTPLVEGWALQAVCEHLEAVTRGEINRLLINVPPGFMKSLLVNVFWPAWEWGPMGRPETRYVTFSYAASLTERDNARFRDLICSPEFQELWSHRFEVRDQGKVKTSNNRTGWKLASSVGGVGTGERGDRVLLDDPHNVKEAESDQVRGETTRWFRESMSNRLNDMEKSAIIVIMQRVHEDDVSGVILAGEMGYTHLMVPMEYDEGRHCETDIGWSDPREEDGELAWPERFPPQVVADMQRNLGPYAYAGQYQQAPVPRGGGIFKREWWQPWEPEDGKWPSFDFLLAYADTAFTQDQENDPTGCTVWGVFDLAEPGQQPRPQVMLVKAWRKHLEMHGELLEKGENESVRAWLRRSQPHWGLCEWLAETCRFRNSDGRIIGTVDRLVIEAKASGISAAQEMQRIYKNDPWITTLDQVKGDKVARAHAAVPAWSQGLVWAPDRDWVDMVVDEMAVFPKGRYKDLTDSATGAIKWLRENGFILRPDEIRADSEHRSMLRKKKTALYPA